MDKLIWSVNPTQPFGVEATAVLWSENGYLTYLKVPALSEETAEFILHEMLDELGYDGEPFRMKVGDVKDEWAKYDPWRQEC